MSRTAHFTLAACLLLSLLGASQASAVEGLIGEPYKLLGKRVYFKDWQFVHPGDLAWTLEGKNVSVGDTVEPGKATLKTVHHPYGIRVIVEKPERRGPLLEAVEPWETQGVIFTTVLKDGDVYKAWGMAKGGEIEGDCYFESTDGLNWTRPELDVIQIDGRKTNLLTQRPLQPWIWVAQVFIDPVADPAERYKMVQMGQMDTARFEEYKKQRPDDWEVKAQTSNHVKFIEGGVSPDGIHWTMLPEPLVVEHCDTHIIGEYDQKLGQYVIYTRKWHAGPRAEGATEGDWSSIARRAIGRTASTDFRRFPLSLFVMIPTLDMPPSHLLYNNGKTTMPGTPDQHLMFTTIWDIGADYTYVRLATSPDNTMWEFAPGDRVFEPGQQGEWDGGCVFAFPNLIELPGGDFALPYGGYDVPHKYPRGQYHFFPGYMIWPKGRLTALQAEHEGEFSMPSVVLPGGQLLVNALVEPGGSIQIQVQGDPERTFELCDPITGDCHWKTVTWGGKDNLGRAAGETARLQFKLKNARLYGLEFAGTSGQ